MTSIPNHFYYNDQLCLKLAVNRPDSSVLVFIYQEEDKFSLPLISVRKNFKKAYTFAKAAKLLNVTKGRVREVYEKGLLPFPEKSYDLATYRPKAAYIKEDDMYDLRDTLYDLLRKNKWGIPFDQSLASEEDLRLAMMGDDDRDFMSVDGDVVRIWRA